MTKLMTKLIYLLMFAAALSGPVAGQTSQESLHSAQCSSESLEGYVPVLDSVKAKFWKMDPAVGYVVKSFGGGVYVISDNGWQSAFLVTDEGVIVFDAPASFGKHIPSAISKVTDKPIKMLTCPPKSSPAEM
jgi:hypothetical protein